MSVLDRLWPDRDAEPDWPPDLDCAAPWVCDLLSSCRRQRTLLLLDDGPRTQREISEAIAEAERGPDVGHAGYKAAYVGLHQAHLPALEDAGVIEPGWDAGDRMVRPGPAYDRVRGVLAAVQEADHDG